MNASHEKKHDNKAESRAYQDAENNKENSPIFELSPVEVNKPAYQEAPGR